MIFICLCNKTKCKAHIMTSYFTAKFAALYQSQVTWRTGRFINLKKRKKKAFFLGMLPHNYLKKAEGLKSIYPRDGSRTAPSRALSFSPSRLFDLYNYIFISLASSPWFGWREGAESASRLQKQLYHTAVLQGVVTKQNLHGVISVYELKWHFISFVCPFQSGLPPDSIVVRKIRNPYMFPFQELLIPGREKKFHNFSSVTLKWGSYLCIFLNPQSAEEVEVSPTHELK